MKYVITFVCLGTKFTSEPFASREVAEREMKDIARVNPLARFVIEELT